MGIQNNQGFEENTVTVIKPVDKGSTIVIMKKSDCISESYKTLGSP